MSNRVVVTLACLLATTFLISTAQKTPTLVPVDGPGSTISQKPRPRVGGVTPLLYGLPLMARLDMLPQFRDTKCVMDSSYDHSGGNGDSDHFLRKEGNKAILSDIRGPGCIYRFWSANAAGHLKIFFDGETTPRIDCPMQDLFLGKVAPFVAPVVGHKSGGWYSYFPMAFEQGCRIEVTDPGGMYYHVQYQLFPDGTPVKTFTTDLTPEDQKALGTVVEQWKHLGDDPVVHETPETKLAGAFDLKVGSTKTFANIRGAGEIHALRIKMNPADRQSLRKTVLRAFWDDSKKPAIESPVGDFFGIAFGDQRYKSLPSAMSDDGYVCYWPMPFGKRAKFELANMGNESLKHLTWSIEFDKLKKPIENVGWFHAQWHRQTTVNGEYFHILNTTGRGVYVGEHTDMQGDRGLGFLEGDEKLFTDGETFPSIYGTGTEDFYTGGWYFDEGPFNLAYHGCTVKSDAFSRISAYRYQITDCVPFQHDIKVEIEHGGTNDYPGADYSCVAFWYQDSTSHDWSPIDPKQLSPATMKVAGVQEAETFTWTNTTAKVMDDSTFAVEASGGKVMAVTGNNSFKFTVASDDYFKLNLNSIILKDSPEICKYVLDGVVLRVTSTPIPAPDRRRQPTPATGTMSAIVKLSKGEHTISTEVPDGKTLYLDYLQIEPSKKEKGAVEAETLAVRADTGGKEAVTTIEANLGYSGYGALQWSPKSASSYLKLPITVTVEAEYTLEAAIAKLKNSARIAAQIDGGDMLTSIDTIDPATTGVKLVRLATNLKLTAGAHVLTLYYKGEDPASTSPTLVIDYLKLLKYRFPYSVEAESLKVLDYKDGNVSNQDMAGFGPDWSGDSQMWFTGNKLNAEVTLELPVQTGGHFDLSVYFTTAADYGKIQTLMDGKPIGDPTDCYSSGVHAKGKTNLGGIDLTAGNHRITFRAVGKNPSGTNYMIGVDAIQLEPK